MGRAKKRREEGGKKPSSNLSGTRLFNFVRPADYRVRGRRAGNDDSGVSLNPGIPSFPRGDLSLSLSRHGHGILIYSLQIISRGASITGR